MLLDGLSPQEQTEVRQWCRRRRFATGEHLFHAGDIGDALHYIDRGRVLILLDTAGGDHVPVGGALRLHARAREARAPEQ